MLRKVTDFTTLVFALHSFVHFYHSFKILSGATNIERYDLRSDTWHHVDEMNGRRLQFGVAMVGGKIIVVGGRDGLKTLNSVESYDPTTKTWTNLPPMSTHRHGLGENS